MATLPEPDYEVVIADLPAWADPFTIPDEETNVVAWQHFNCFVQDVGRKVHNLHTDTLKVALTNTLPVASNTVLANITQVTAANGYSSGGAAVTNNGFTQSAGVASLIGDDVTFTASGGDIAAWRYAVLYNDTASGDPLISWVDYGASIIIRNGGHFTVDLPVPIATLQVAA